MRKATEERLMVLQEQYWGGKAKQEGARARDTQKQFGQTSDSVATPGATKSFKKGTAPSGILKKGPQARESLAKPKFDYRNLKKDKSKDSDKDFAGKGRSRSKGGRDRVGFKSGSSPDF